MNTTSTTDYFVLPALRRAPDRWAAMRPEIVVDGSSEQIVWALRDAQHDISKLVDALSEAVRRLANA